jgi:hypothetical protein
MEYENVTQTVLLSIELMLRISWHVRFKNYRPWGPP